MSSGKHGSDEARRIAEAGTILRCLVGSGLHGLSISDQDDRDEMGVCVEPPEFLIGLRRIQLPDIRDSVKFGQYEHHTAWERPGGLANRSGPGDLDVVVYSLRKYMRLALAGNPTVLLPLFAPWDAVAACTELGQELRGMRSVILSRQAGRRFAGYLDAQRRSLLSRDGKGRDVTRPELIEAYGFDCYLDDTEFLTRHGWLTYDEIADGEAVGTVNRATGAVEFQVPTDRVAKPYSGPIYYFRGRYTACAVTPNHRMWVSPVNRGPSGRIGSGYRSEVANWSFRRADTLHGLHHVRAVGTPREDEYPVTDGMLAVVGAYLSEGEIGKRLASGAASVLRFTQQIGGNLESTLAAAAAEYPMRSWAYTRTDGGRAKACDYRVYTLANRSLAAQVDSECGHGSWDKHLPTWAFGLSARQSEILLDALMAGDGTRCPGGWQVYYSISRRLAGDIQALAMLAGRRSNVWGPYACAKGMYQVMVQDPGPEYNCLRIRENLTVADVADRRIVCFTVPNEILVTRRDGRVSMHGNTKFCGHMVRLGLQGVELMETGRITLPVPEPDRTWIRELRAGQHTMTEALERAAECDRRISELLDKSPLPEEPDYAMADAWLISAYQRAWA